MTETAGQSAAERAEWPLEHWSDSEKTAYHLGYAAGAREQAGRVTLSQEEIKLIEYELDTYTVKSWSPEQRAALQEARAKLRAALAAP